MPTTNVGVIGLGTVGDTLARRLLDLGLEVTVHDRDPWAMMTLAAAGADPARIPADAAEPADVVFVHLPDEAAVEEALFDCGGVGETLRDGGFVVAASSTGATFVHSAADRLGALGLNIVEAWFTGHSGDTPDTVLVGCAAEELEALAPVLRLVADNVVHIGPLGSVSALRAAVAVLSTGRPPQPPDEMSAAAVNLRQMLMGLPGSVSSGSAPDRRSGRCRAQSSSALAGPLAGPFVHGRPVSDARKQTDHDRAHAGGLPPRAPRQLGVPAVRRSRRSSTVPPGVLTLQELVDLVDAVCERGLAPGPAAAATAGEPHPDPNCLGLTGAQFEAVVTELERRCGIPLLRESLQCSSPEDLVALVNTQVTSGV
jgi:NAD binding domain of 6-phosphogluconate dehydrogenase